MFPERQPEPWERFSLTQRLGEVARKAADIINTRLSEFLLYASDYLNGRQYKKMVSRERFWEIACPVSGELEAHNTRSLFIKVNPLYPKTKLPPVRNSVNDLPYNLYHLCQIWNQDKQQWENQISRIGISEKLAEQLLGNGARIVPLDPNELAMADRKARELEINNRLRIDPYAHTDTHPVYWRIRDHENYRRQ